MKVEMVTSLINFIFWVDTPQQSKKRINDKIQQNFIKNNKICLAIRADIAKIEIYKDYRVHIFAKYANVD